ncbi:nicotinamide riboside transporter PnuC [Blattabacterium cuenoti]|uniref:nicotinamide riboside transporter PnuC n=1 Tax=Blattabacterium cuenoti TaxID=1653831 RepID=UPI00163B6EA7|nr:nicotinamide riboside transporter PnuC [Blattabacterium cuenoti]
MNEWIKILLYPTNNSSLIHILLEFIAVIFCICSVIFAKNYNIWLYPLGIISTIIYSYLTFFTSLYGDFLINIYYTVMSFYGWYIWIYKKDKNNKKIPITFSDTQDYVYTFLLFVFTFIISIMVYGFTRKVLSHYDWMDILTTGIFFSGMYQMAIKKVENWIFFMMGNIISVPIYFLKGFILTGFLFIFLSFIAITGYIVWKNKAIKNL